MRVPVAVFEALRNRSVTFRRLSRLWRCRRSVRTPEGLVRITGRRVSANYLSVLGVRPLQDCRLLPGNGAGAPAVMMVSYVLAGGVSRRSTGNRSDTRDGRVLYHCGRNHAARFQTTFGIRGDDFWTPYVSEKARPV